ncbi:endo-alpha-12-mannosidase [Holotrichia oblita]|uniref:Endo-alpha-12-mannosidase n=1 Tax=Holotrichia oblita TaxID=644536 RepID=A0ACB9SW18_HOLOL|nr:endo-alpha-12-mannosidase [Holotrichia oblita]
MSDINEARKNLELTLGEDLKKQYYDLLKQWLMFKDPITKLQFDSAVRKIAIHAWENGLEGADDNVAEYLVYACQIFVKNIITAMISRKEGYKIRDSKFQHSFGLPVPDPFIRNTNNIIDNTQEPKVEVGKNDDSFVPAYRNTLEVTEQQVAFSYACGKKKYSDGKLTVKLLYDTLRENKNIVGLHSVHSLNLLKMGLYVQDP